MRVAEWQQAVRSVVFDDALKGQNAPPGEEGLLARLNSDRQALEAVARQKCREGGVAADGAVAITLSDLVTFAE